VTHVQSLSIEQRPSVHPSLIVNVQHQYYPRGQRTLQYQCLFSTFRVRHLTMARLLTEKRSVDGEKRRNRASMRTLLRYPEPICTPCIQNRSGYYCDRKGFSLFRVPVIILLKHAASLIMNRQEQNRVIIYATLLHLATQTEGSLLKYKV
jgi:hypothetical protein